MIYRVLFDLVLRRLPPTASHALGSRLLRLFTAPPPLRRLLRAWAYPHPARLTVHALGLTFPSPLGAAAGIDKSADWFESLGTVGFGCVEIGTVTPAAQDPNPAPTIVRIPADRALLNRMGFPNDGAEQTAERLQRRSDATIVGANIGKQRSTALTEADVDYVTVARRLAPHADYVAVNVSSPNTPGLRDLGTVEKLEPLLEAVKRELAEVAPGRPLLVKISPDMHDEEIDAIAELAVRLELDGIIATNTTVDRSGLVNTPVATLRWFNGGGVSGRPLKARSLAVLRRLYARTEGRVTLISVGGVESVDDVWERVASGATLVQAYTGFVYGGPAWAARINRQLAERVKRSGRDSIQDMVGAVVGSQKLFAKN